MDASRFKKVLRANKTPVLNTKADLDQSPEDGIVSPTVPNRTREHKIEARSSNTPLKKVNPSLAKYQPSKLVIDIMSNYFNQPT